VFKNLFAVNICLVQLDTHLTEVFFAVV